MVNKVLEIREKAINCPKLLKVSKYIHLKTKKEVESYNIQEGTFKKGNVLPIFARGLFVSPENDTIIARGYDKFFNINEIRQTKWENIEKDTVGPYELTLKENGCIIFVSAIDNELFVTSKHSFTHINSDGELFTNKYSDLGEVWLNKYIGDKKDQLVKFIKENKVTLVFELIDNDFEEHVLEYSKEEEGLYLHGINTNTVEFNTWPSEKVSEVAKEFNLTSVKYITYNNVNDLKKFAESCKGYYNGRAIEGWVIRCKKTSGETFFFKYKYDEPYLLFREWREAVVAYIDEKKLYYRYDQTKDYMKFIKEKYQTNGELFSEFKKKKGIIKLRNLYFEECVNGKYVPKLDRPVTKENALRKLILPVGLTGFGKTTVRNMLSILYNIGFVQNNSLQKKAKTDFTENILNEFKSKDIVMADKINHLNVQRMKLLERLFHFYPNTLWTVALRWNIKSVPEKDILEFVRERVEERGENHEVITPEKSPNYPFYIKYMINDYNEINLNSPEDSLINEIIDIDFREDSISIVNKIIKALNLEPKSPEEIEKAYKEAREMKITEEERIANPNNKASPINWGLRTKYISSQDIALKSLKSFVDQNKKYSNEFEQVKSIIDNGNFAQREHIDLTNKKDSKEVFKYYDDLIGPTNQINNFNNPELETTLQASSIVWTSNSVFMPIDTIESDKLMKKPEDSENKNQNYYIMIAFEGNEKKINCPRILADIDKYYENNPDHKPTFPANDTIPVIDQSYVIDDTNKNKENEIIHPNTLPQLLPTTLKNTSFIEPIEIVEGPDWKQLLFKPFKFKAYFTKLYY